MKLLILCAALVLTAPLNAQSTTPAAPGDSVRAYFSNNPDVGITGRLLQTSDDSLVMQIARARLAAPRSALLRLDRWVPQHPDLTHRIVTGASYGTLTGATIGLSLAALVLLAPCEEGPCDRPFMKVALVPTAVGAGTGALVGFLVSGPRWISASLSRD